MEPLVYLDLFINFNHKKVKMLKESLRHSGMVSTPVCQSSSELNPLTKSSSMDSTKSVQQGNNLVLLTLLLRAPCSFKEGTSKIRWLHQGGAETCQVPRTHFLRGPSPHTVFLNHHKQLGVAEESRHKANESPQPCFAGNNEETKPPQEVRLRHFLHLFGFLEVAEMEMKDALARCHMHPTVGPCR